MLFRSSSVDNMFRRKNLRHVCDGASSLGYWTGEPPNMPDSETNGKDLFFVHGFNVSEEAARNWSRQVFKRLWLSGSRARFHGISWYGDYNLAGSAFNGPDIIPNISLYMISYDRFLIFSRLDAS